MIKKAVLTSRAEKELTDSIEWYESKEKGLGSSFLLNVDAAIASVVANPEQHPRVYKSIRRVLIKRFPYSMFYLSEPYEIVILAVFHERRNPSNWKKEL
jgi:plasmid stabilization system protein ParE